LPRDLTLFDELFGCQFDLSAQQRQTLQYGHGLRLAELMEALLTLGTQFPGYRSVGNGRQSEDREQGTNDKQEEDPAPYTAAEKGGVDFHFGGVISDPAQRR
jgi:hypothetical protein